MEEVNMAFVLNVLSLSTAVCSLWGEAVAQGAEVKGVDNAEQFALLCRIYNVAKNPPINHVDVQDPRKIVNEIDAINSSFIEEKQFNETDQLGNSSDAQLKPTTTRGAAVTEAILKRITQKAHTILEEIKKVNATRDIEKIKDEFAQVIFGDGMNESRLCGGVLNGVRGRGAACGPSGLPSRGNDAGKNLVVDFFCLCAMRTDKEKEGIGNVCGVDVGGKGGKREKPDNHGWSELAPLGIYSMWASIKKGCGNLMHQTPKSTKEGNEVLKDFLKHLKGGGLYRWGARVEDSGRKKGMLGTGVGKQDTTGGSGPVCDGSRGNTKGTPPGGICVYYGPENWEQNIDWLKKLKAALTSVDALNNKTATIQRDIQKLHTLLHRAEEIYETAKVITEIQNPVIPTNLQTAAKRLTAYNAAWRNHPHAHFILLFVLL